MSRTNRSSTQVTNEQTEEGDGEQGKLRSTLQLAPSQQEDATRALIRSAKCRDLTRSGAGSEGVLGTGTGAKPAQLFPLRVVLYARFSTSDQSLSSIVDPIRSSENADEEDVASPAGTRRGGTG